MNRLTVVSGVNKGVNPEGLLPAKKSIFTIGGCNAFEIFNDLREVVEFTHFWRGAVPSIMSSPIELQHANFESEEFSRLLDREASKVIYKRIRDAPDTVIVFEAAGDFATGVLKIDDTIIADVRSSVFHTSFPEIVFHEQSQLSKAQLISTDSPHYWDLWKYYFHNFYHDLLKERIQRGVGVFFFSRRCCLTELKDGEFIPLQNVRAIAARNLILDEIDHFVSQYDGVEIIRSDPSLEFTSTDAPWGGPWEFHPQQAYYADLRAKFLDSLFPGRRRGDRYLGKWMAENAQSLSNTKAILARAESDVVEANNAVAQLQSDRDHIAQNLEIVRIEQVALEQKLENARASQIALEQELEATQAEREVLGQELATAEAQTATVAAQAATVEAQAAAYARELEIAKTDMAALQQNCEDAAILEVELGQKLETVQADALALQKELDATLTEKVAIRQDFEIVRSERDSLSDQLREMDRIIQESRELAHAFQSEILAKNNVIDDQEGLNSHLAGELAGLERKLSGLEAALDFSSNRYGEKKPGLLYRIARFIAIRFDMKQLRRLGFNENAYLAQNDDVRTSGIDPAQHYIMHGMRERRNFPQAR